MIVTLEMHGGFAGLRRPASTIDMAALSPESSAELAALVDAAGAASPAKASDAVRDGITYHVTVKADGKPDVVLSQTDGSITPAFSELLAALRKLSGKA
jgi:hypothetical protein